MYQSGFRTNHSRDFYLAQLIDFVLTGKDKMHWHEISRSSESIIDTLDHKVLLQKMKYFGFRTCAIKWFQSYPSNFWFVLITLKYSVPKGSFLGPLTFLLYVDDLPQ